LTPGEVSGEGLLRYLLRVANNSPRSATVRLAASEPTGVLQISAPPSLTVAPGATEQVPLEIRQLRKARNGGAPLQLQVAALNEGGQRVAFVNTSVLPAVSASRGKPLLIALAAGFAIAGAAAGAFLLLRSGDDKPAQQPQQQATESASVAAGSPIPTAPVGTLKVLERWDYTFRVESNDCGFGAQPGDRYSTSFRYEPATGSATTIKDGDRVKVTGLQSNEVALGTFTFKAAHFEVTYPVAAADGKRGNATLVSTFVDDSNIGNAVLTEKYEAPACSIVANFAK
jgi:hypothetical protein